MQDDGSDMLRLKWLKLGQRTEFLARFESLFFVYAFLHPVSYAQRFCELKDLINMQFCGRFQQYRICGCEV